MNEAPVALAALALTGTIATGFFALIRQQNKVHEKVASSMDKVAQSNEKIAEATIKGSQEAKERNGHLAELVLQQGEQTISIAHDATDKIIEVVQNIKEQHIEHSHIAEQTIDKGDD